MLCSGGSRDLADVVDDDNEFRKETDGVFEEGIQAWDANGNSTQAMQESVFIVRVKVRIGCCLFRSQFESSRFAVSMPLGCEAPATTTAIFP